MTREQLEHAIRAACDVLQDTEVYVFGSQAILAQFPDAPAELRQSMEADIAPKNRPEAADRINGPLGELSDFHNTHGFYVHGLPIEAARLPRGWTERVVPIRNPNTRNNTGLCVEGHDLAASKLAAFRDKDREFVRVLLASRMVESVTLKERIVALADLEAERIEKLHRWVELTARGG